MFAKPDRSEQQRNFVKTAENDVLDLAFGEGILSDGRPYVVEFWCQDQISLLTFFLPRKGIEDASVESMKSLVIREGLLSFKSDRQYVSLKPFRDGSGNDIWSVNVVVGDERSTFISDHVPLRPYDKSKSGRVS